MSEPFIGEIRMVGFNFAPRGWAMCDGQLLPISQFTALFSLLGTIYGGDGEVTFALPDLRGRVPIHFGNGPGLSSYQIGARGGIETLPHTITTGLSGDVEGHTHELAGGPSGPGIDSTSLATIPTTVGASSSAPSHDNRQPYLAINFIIALSGLFPSPS